MRFILNIELVSVLIHSLFRSPYFNNFREFTVMKKIILSLILLFLHLAVFAQTGNEFLGENAGASNSSGDFNVIIGDQAGAENASGSSNVIMGYQAVESYQGGGIDYADNVIIGMNACRGLRNGADDGWTSRCHVSDSVIIGKEAGMVITEGYDLVVIGQGAGKSITTANDTVLIGSQVGESLTTGRDNVFIGDDSGADATTAKNNVLIGSRSGFELTTGYENVGIGRSALFKNETGRHNTVIGYEAGSDIGTSGTVASWNTALGSLALTDSDSGVGNVAIGGGAGSRIEYADFNTFVGTSAGGRTNFHNIFSSGNRNTGMGSYAGYHNEEGSDNVWIGGYAGTKRFLGTGSFDASLDVTELETCTNNCVPSGPVPQNDSTSGVDIADINRTTVLGSFAAAGYHDSVVVGYNAWARNERSIVMGANSEAYDVDSVIIGDNANAAQGSARSVALGADAVITHADSINIGYGVASHAANTMTIGNASTVSWDPGTDAVTSLGTQSYRFSDVTSNKISINATSSSAAEIDLFADAGAADDDKWTISVANGGNFSISSFVSGVDIDKLSIANTGDVVIAGDLVLNSDRRLKTDIHSIQNSLDIISTLDGVTFYWKEKTRKTGEHFGFVAQEVEQTLPQLVSQDKIGIKSVNYQSVVPILVNAINELNKNNNKQDKRMRQLQNLIEQQQALIVKLLN